ncbi:hypothetical protein LR48_Vigan583s000100 [Vigna angularis]|uniref:Uncharacterized protein n=1 Tax=Phaseolus angularis TaxID=3914 RepID=A0A0L9TDQ4_PHAAN|nr:hypothetical protein LR48_Vigan583s000100 [Vigna angularis]
MAEPSRRRRRRSYGSESTPIARGPNIQGWISDDGKHDFARLSKQLEDMSLAQKTHFEEIYEWRRSVDEYMVDQFLDLDVRLSNIEGHLNIPPPERSPSPEF